MLPGQNRTGVGKKAFLQTPESIYQKDPYKDQLSVELQYHNKMHTKSPMHETDFVPASGFKTMYDYPHSAQTRPSLMWRRSSTRKRRQKRTNQARLRPSLPISSPTRPPKSKQSSTSPSPTCATNTAAGSRYKSRRGSYGRARSSTRSCSSP